jgi:hypothetical protein
MRQSESVNSPSGVHVFVVTSWFFVVTSWTVHGPYERELASLFVTHQMIRITHRNTSSLTHEMKWRWTESLTLLIKLSQLFVKIQTSRMSS